MPSRTRRRSLPWAIAAVLATSTAAGVAVQSAPAQAASFNYGEALQKSFLFYEAQVSGVKPSWDRVSWRGDATVNDGKADGVDLSGGFYDAGDHMKFGFPMAAATTTLAWGGVDERDAYERSGQLTPLLNTLRQANDYFVNAHPSPNVLYVQVGEASDHNYWGSPETVEAKWQVQGKTRPVYKITTACPGTDVAAETAAAMASSAMVFRATDPGYADKLLGHAKQLFTFADSTKGTTGKDTTYINCVPGTSSFYNPTAEGGGQNDSATKVYWDELAWASIWLYRATGDSGYLDRAREFYPKMGTQTDVGSSTRVPVYGYGYGWNDKEYGVYVEMAKLTGEQQYKDDAQRWLDYWTTGYKGARGKYTPGGMAFILDWGSLRMAASTAWVALNYANWLGPNDSRYATYRDFGKRQIDYALGDNPRKGSYVAGFGTNFPRNIHHRGATGAWLDASTAPPPAVNRHVLVGGMVGGPDASDGWKDDRSDFQHNEVAIDYNAGYTSALAALYDAYGGSPLASIPDETPDNDEIWLDGTLTNDNNGTTGKVFIVNESAWPARVLAKAHVRYFFTLDGSTTASQIAVSSPYSNCKAPTGPTQWSGSTYFLDIDCTGTLSFPGGQSEYRREIQFKLQSSGTWDPSNDPSAAGVAAMALYDDSGKLIWGKEPGGGTTTTTTTTTRPTTTTTTTTRPVTTTTTTTTRPVTTTTTTTTTTTRATTTTTTTRATTTTTTRPTTTTTRPTTTTTTTRPTTTTTTGTTGCTAAYKVTSQWQGGFQGDVTVTAGRAISGWTVTWTYASGQSVTQAWNATVTSSGSSVTATNLSWNGSLGAGGTASFGFLGSATGSNPVPAVTCTAR